VTLPTPELAWNQRGCFTDSANSMKNRFRRSLKRGAEWCQTHRHPDVDWHQATLNAKLLGHYQYYGRPTNYRSLRQFYRGVQRTWKKWLGRRTRGRTLTWGKYGQLLHRHPLLRPRITPPWGGTVRLTLGTHLGQSAPRELGR